MGVDDVAVITVDNPPVNALSAGIPEIIAESINSAAADPNIKAVVVIGAGSTFIAGADIREFDKIASGEKPPLDLLPFLLTIENCPKPVVMAIHGTAFGAGLETAVAGHYRVVAHWAQIGQPEVKLGLIPGAAGTQRLPRLAGPKKAVEMCAFGEPITAQEAVQSGIADRMIDGDLLEGAVAFAREVADLPIPRTRARNEKLMNVEPGVFDAARNKARKLRRGQTAPLAAIDAVEAATKLSFEEGCQREAELFNGCIHSAQSKALIYAFFGERTVSKVPGLSSDVYIRTINRAAVIGAGTMGAGIAMAFANAGVPVLLKETTSEALDRGMQTIRRNYASTVERGRLSQAEADVRMARVTPQLNYNGFENADIIVEAVFEDLEAKKRVFSELGAVANSNCILASNTSSLDLDQLASASGRAESVIGLHFFSPANVMRLLEVVRGSETGDTVLATSMALAKKLRKIAVLSRNAPGFISNRTIVPYLNEAHLLLEEGASVEEVNSALVDFGMAMGPLAMEDLTGLDVFRNIRGILAHLRQSGARQPVVPDLLTARGRLGQKTGAGWSKYDTNRRSTPNSEVAALLEQASADAGIQRRHISPQEIVDRCLRAVIAESKRVLAEGVALRPVDIDIVYIHGFGFPAWRGGPMFYGETVLIH